LVRERLLAEAPELDVHKAKLMEARSDIKGCKARLNEVGPPKGPPGPPLYKLESILDDIQADIDALLNKLVAKDDQWNTKLQDELIPVREILTTQLDRITELERCAKIDQGVQIVALVEKASNMLTDDVLETTDVDQLTDTASNLHTQIDNMERIYKEQREYFSDMLGTFETKASQDKFREKLAKKQREQRRNIRMQQQELNTVEGYLKNFAADLSRCAFVTVTGKRCQMTNPHYHHEHKKYGKYCHLHKTDGMVRMHGFEGMRVKEGALNPEAFQVDRSGCSLSLWCGRSGVQRSLGGAIFEKRVY
jgi:hypothetical protein